MQLNKLNNIIFLKDIESNIIDEAFIVLKDNVKIHKVENDKNNIKGNVNILKEAELLVNKKINEGNIEYEKFKIKRLEKKIRTSRIINVILVISMLLVFKILN